MNYSERVKSVLTKYKILDSNGNVVQTNNTTDKNGTDRTGAVVDGPGPIVRPDVLEKLINADITPTKKWLDWIFFEAGGGTAAQNNLAPQFEKMRTNFMNQATTGTLKKPKSTECFPRMSQADAERMWASRLESFNAKFNSGEQNVVVVYEVFGFYRNWPGRNRIYEKVVSTLKKWFELEPYIKKYNEEMSASDQKTVAHTPKTVGSVDNMIAILDKVETYFAAKRARSDVRIGGDPSRKDKLIFSDDYITVFAPLTQAAAVKYGFSNWKFADPEAFEDYLTQKTNQNPWKSAVGSLDVLIFLRFNYPVPAWVKSVGSEFSQYSLRNLYMVLTQQDRNSNPESWSVYDEENKTRKTIKNIINDIQAEPTREDTETEKSYPISRGANVYASTEEADEVVRHLRAALAAIKQWMGTFDPTSVTRDPLKFK